MRFNPSYYGAANLIRCHPLPAERADKLLEKNMMTVKILGSGCANCKRLEQLTAKVLAELDMEAEIVKVTTPSQYADYGVMATPGLVINETLACSGRIPSIKELTGFLSSPASSE